MLLLWFLFFFCDESGFSLFRLVFFRGLGVFIESLLASVFGGVGGGGFTVWDGWFFNIRSNFFIIEDGIFLLMGGFGSRFSSN